KRLPFPVCRRLKSLKSSARPAASSSTLHPVVVYQLLKFPIPTYPDTGSPRGRSKLSSYPMARSLRNKPSAHSNQNRNVSKAATKNRSVRPRRRMLLRVNTFHTWSGHIYIARIFWHPTQRQKH